MATEENSGKAGSGSAGKTTKDTKKVEDKKPEAKAPVVSAADAKDKTAPPAKPVAKDDSAKKVPEKAPQTISAKAFPGTQQKRGQDNKSGKGDRKQGGGRSRRGGRRDKKKEESEFDQNIIDVARVTRVTEGGKQMSFRATVVIGDRKGRVGVGLGKGLDVTNAISKAVDKAKKTMIVVPLNDQGTIPHEVKMKFGAARIMLRPAPQGTGIIAGGVMRMILDVAGVKNATAKMYGSKSKINNSKATILALKSLQTQEVRTHLRG